MTKYIVFVTYQSLDPALLIYNGFALWESVENYIEEQYSGAPQPTVITVVELF